MISSNLDIIVISETKLDSSFPELQFYIEGFSQPYRRDRNSNGGGLLVYIREDIPSKVLTGYTIPDNTEGMFIEINLRKKKILLFCGYNPKKGLISEFTNSVGRGIDSYSSKYENLLLIGDFNSEPTEPAMDEFCELYNLTNLVKEPTCFKNPNNPSLIDLMLANHPRSFQDTSVIETGLSDCHKMTVTVLKVHFQKLPPKVITYRDYKNFNTEIFEKKLSELLVPHKSDNFVKLKLEEFKNSIVKLLNQHAPIKKKILRGNDAKFMTKELRQAIMKRTKLRKHFLKTRLVSDNEAFKKQRNKCTSILRKAKKSYFDQLDPKNITDNKTFWKTVSPYLTNKSKKSEKIILVENENIVVDETELTEIFSVYFHRIVPNLNIEPYEDTFSTCIGSKHPVFSAIEKYKNHPSIVAIKQNVHEYKFSFTAVNENEVATLINNLDIKKCIQENDIPTKILKNYKNIFTEYISNDVNKCISSTIFPKCLKNSEVIPTYKKGDKTDKSNYRPISILPNISKIYEKCMLNQINTYFNKIFSKFQLGFRKGCSTQHCLLAMVEKWKNALDKGEYAGALLTDLSKAFDCLPHDLLIAKLEAYGFDTASLNFIHDYLSERSQRVKIGLNKSLPKELEYGVPQGSILGPLLFNIFICDMFFIICDLDIANFADDTTPFAFATNLNNLINKLEIGSEELFNWFTLNLLKANANKCHFLNSSLSEHSLTIKDNTIPNSTSVRLLGITIDGKVSFNEHVTNLCKIGSQKLHALTRISDFMSEEKRKLIMKAFFTSQFSYCPLVWMFHSRTLNNRINKLHERALRIVYKDNDSSFEELLKKDNSVTIHERNLQVLATEIFKWTKNQAPQVMNDIFQHKSHRYNLRHGTDLRGKNARTNRYGTESISFIAPEIWKQVPDDLREIDSVALFKKKIKGWKPLNCPCRLCKTYINNIGFL